MKIFEYLNMQKQLDNYIYKNKKIKKEKIKVNKYLALFVELGELINALNKNDKAEILKEYVDCLHFVLSIGNDFGIYGSNIEFEFIPRKKSIYFSADWFVAEYSDFLNKIDGWKYWKNQVSLDKDYLCHLWYELLFEFKYLGQMIGLNTQQVEEAYFKKNKINYQRQIDNY